MASNIQDLLGYVSLTGIINAQTPGLPDVLPPAFQNIKQNVIGDSGRYTQVTGTRQTARVVQYGSAARRRSLRNIAIRDAKLMHSYEELALDPIVFQALREFDNYNKAEIAGQEVTRQVMNFRMLFTNLRKTAIMQALSNGIIYIDDDNNLLPSSSGAQYSIDFGMSANNQDQLNGIITASWANFSTDIPGQIRALQARALQDTGYPLRYAFYGRNIPSYMTQNNYVQDYLSRNPSVAKPYLDTAELPGLFGLTWVPAYEFFFQDNTETNNTVVDADKVIFTPEPSQEWWEILEGSFPVPTTLNIQSDAVAAMRSLKEVNGAFAYGCVVDNPPSVVMRAGDTFLPVIKVPNAIYQADTVP